MARKKANRVGRREGGHNRGYWYRKNRGWYVTEGRSSVPLRDSQGNHIRSADAAELAREAYAQYVVARKERGRGEFAGDRTALIEICRVFLDYAHKHSSASTYEIRADFLFDFCTGFPPRFRDKENGKKPPKPDKRLIADGGDRIHPGYGTLAVGDLIPFHVQQWLDAHPDWNGSRRTALQSLRRALTYAVTSGLISRNPVKGIKIPAPGMRVAYFTDEQEQAIYANASPALALAVKVCIRTGARPVVEFAQLEARHVEETDRGQCWRFRAGVDRTKTGGQTRKDRVIYAPEEIAEIVRERIKRYPTGPLFRNGRGDPWTDEALRAGWKRMRRKLRATGIKTGEEFCMYACRHTFAKRMLGGYWTGKPTSIEILAGLMGNSREVCWKHYGQWCDSYQDPLWDALK